MDKTKNESNNFFSLLTIDFWKKWETVSKHQMKIVEHYQEKLFGAMTLKSIVQLAPQYLNQDINPIHSSLVNFGDEYHSTNPELEKKIVKDIAGYGSQLGTIIDYLNLLGKYHPLNPEDGASADKSDEKTIDKFKYISNRIKALKN
jgi:hypothetical protein